MTRRLIKQVVKLLADAGELQPGQHGIEPVGGDCRAVQAGHQKPPPMSVSYSPSGRSKLDDARGAGAGSPTGGGLAV